MSKKEFDALQEAFAAAGVKVKAVKVAELKEYENNPRKNKKAVAAVAESIKTFGFKNPIIIDKDGVIIAGHTRKAAAQQLGLDTVPCIIADDLTPEQAAAFRLADNKTAELAEWDFDKLNEEIKALADFPVNMADFGFDLSEFEERKEVEEVEPEEEEEEAEIVPRVKAGEVWQLGRHRLMCGDSTDKADVLKLLDGAKADMVFTDPPYGVNVEGGKNNKTIAGDLTQTAIPFSFEICVEVATKDAARFYFCGGEANISLYFKLFERYLRQMPKLLVWTKENQVLSHNNYHKQYELIFFGYKKGGGNVWYSSREMKDASDVWNVSRDPSKTYVHPTQKPVELPARAIRNHSKAGDVVFEPFGGSGSTLLACEQLDRVCYAMELDPYYCEMILRRWESLTGQTAEKITEGAE
jgi:site-specific DNA-methyltransferase (adenine-specific)